MAKTTKKEKTAPIEAPVVNVDATKFNGMRSMYVILENFKNIDRKVISIGGRSMVFLGPNGSGKSSLIQAMKGSMNSKMLPSEPVKAGEEHARISHKIAGNIAGEYKEYIIDVYFDKKSGNGRLTLTDEKGEDVKSPATKIKDITGNVSYNITKWISAKKDEKLKMLKTLSGRGIDIDKVNMEIKELLAKRKAKNDRAEDLEGVMKNHGMSQDEINLYSKPVDLQPIQSEMENVSNIQREYDKVVTSVEGFKRGVNESLTATNNIQHDINRMSAEMERLRGLIAEKNEAIVAEGAKVVNLRHNIGVGEQWLATAKRPTMEEISIRMSAAITHNEKNKQIGILAEQHKEMIHLKQEGEKMKLDISAKEDERAKIIASSQLNVPGISFTDEEIYFEGLPLEEGQQNTQKLWHIGVQIAKALKPRYKGIFIDDGSLFDKEHLAEVVHEIEKDGEFFAIIEMVEFEGTELEARFTEEVI